MKQFGIVVILTILAFVPMTLPRGVHAITHAPLEYQPSCIPKMAGPGPQGLAFSTYVGGRRDERVEVMLVGEDGTTYIAGPTETPGFAVAGGTAASRKGTYAIAFHADGSLKYATRLSAKSTIAIKKAVLDSEGNLYVVGITRSSDLGATPGCFQSQYAGLQDVAAVKLDPRGRIRYATYLGGTQAEQVNTVHVDGQGFLVITGTTQSRDFPLHKPFQRRFGNEFERTNIVDLFAARLNSNGFAVYSTFIGGNGTEYDAFVFVEPDGSVVMAGSTSALNFKTKNAIQPSTAGSEDLWLLRFSPIGSAIYSTYFGGSSNETIAQMSVDSEGNYILYGASVSPDFPVRSAFQEVAPEGGAYVAKFSPACELIFSTRLGGGQIGKLLIDGADNISVVGGVAASRSDEYPLRNPFDAVAGEFGDEVTATKFAPDGECVYSTLLGGSSIEGLSGAIVDNEGSVYIAGYTSSVDLPVVNAFQSMPAARGGLFVAKLSESGSPVFVTYLDGESSEEFRDMAAGDDGSLAFVCRTRSVDFPTKNAFLQTGFSGVEDVVVVRFESNGAVAFSTFIGGTDDDGQVRVQVTMTPSGNICLVGDTRSTDFPRFGSIGTADTAFGETFLVAFDASGHPIVSQCVGGTGYDSLSYVIASGGELRLTGITTSTSFPLLSPWQGTYGGQYDVFVVGLRL